MEYLIIIIVSIIALLILKYAWDIKIKDIKILKDLGYDESLNKITNKLPENKEICKKLLKKLNNENVKIEESENKTSLYLVLSNSIIIANIKDTFTRVQTVAHECLHSIQNRKTLLFNFVFSNIYFIYFITICILAILKINILPITLTLFILLIFTFIHYAIRSYLEMDAMTKAKSLAEEYLEEEGILSKQEQNIVLDNYEIINNIGIKLTNYILITKNIAKIIFYLSLIIIF